MHGFPTKPHEIKGLLKDSLLFESGYKTIDTDADARNKRQLQTLANSVIIPANLDPELQECFQCEFETSGMSVQRCDDPNMEYN